MTMKNKPISHEFGAKSISQQELPKQISNFKTVSAASDKGIKLKQKGTSTKS
jgi:hypothetical protein